MIETRAPVPLLVAGEQCPADAILFSALLAAETYRQARVQPRKKVRCRPRVRNGRAGTISKFSKQTGYRVSYDSSTKADAQHKDFVILGIRELLLDPVDT